MGKSLNQFRGWICLGLLGVAITALAVDYVFIDISQEPPEVLSARGSVTDADFSDDGVWLEVDEPEGIYVDIEDLGGELEYSLLDKDGRVLKSGGGNYISFLEYPSAKSVLLQSKPEYADDNDIGAGTESNEEGGSVREDPQPSVPRSGGGCSLSESGDAPYFQNAFTQNYSFAFDVVEAGRFLVLMSSDDDACVGVDGLSFTSHLHQSVSNEVYLCSGTKTVSLTWVNIGGPYFIEFSISPLPNSVSEEVPQLSVSPEESRIVSRRSMWLKPIHSASPRNTPTICWDSCTTTTGITTQRMGGGHLGM